MQNKKRKLSKGQKIALNCSILGVVLAAIVVGYACLINFYLLDFDNMGYIEFSYLIKDENDKSETTVRIDKVYANTDYPSDFRIPNRLEGYRVTEIGNSAFSYLDRLTHVTFPNSIVSIGENAFVNCSNLASFNVPTDLVTIGTDAFAGTKYLSNQPNGEVLIGDILYEYKGELQPNTAIIENYESQVYKDHTYSNYISLDKFTSIGSGSFKGKSELKYVEYPAKFQTIPDKLFYECPNLKEAHIRDGIVTVGVSSFEGCSSLETVTWSNTLGNLSENSFKNTAITGALILPDTVYELDSGAFAGAANITSVVIPQAVNYISDDLFASCSSLADVTFNGENSITGTIYYLGTNSFSGTAIHEFTIPFGVQTIKESTFENCLNLEKVYLYDNLTGTTIPSSQADAAAGSIQGVQSIANRAFNGDTNLKSLILLDKDGNAISSEGEINFPESTIVKLGDLTGDSNMFMNSGIEKVVIPNCVPWIPATFAKNCDSLTNITFKNVKGDNPSTLSIIGLSSFEDCDSLTDVTIPSYIKNIGSFAFANCDNLANLDISTTNITTIYNSLIGNDTSITNFVIPSSVKSIKNKAFEGCTSLEYLIIPNNVTNCDSELFYHDAAHPFVSTFKIFLGEGTSISQYTKGWTSNFYYYVYSETEPTEPFTPNYPPDEVDHQGGYWHYVGGVPTVW